MTFADIRDAARCDAEQARIRELAKILGHACDQQRLEDVARLLQEAGDDKAAVLRWSDWNGATLLRDAIHDGLLSVARILVEAGADVNQSGPSSPLVNLAVLRGNLPMVQCLVELGADINLRNAISNSTAVMMAITGRHPEIALYLIRQCAHCGEWVRSSAGQCAASYAAAYDDPQVFLALYETGAMAGALTVPLQRALEHGALKVVAACLDHPQLRGPAEGEALDPALLAACKNDATRQLLLSWRTGTSVTRALEEILPAAGTISRPSKSAPAL